MAQQGEFQEVRGSQLSSQQDWEDAVFSAELFEPNRELRILHRGHLYRLRIAPSGQLELVGPSR